MADKFYLTNSDRLLIQRLISQSKTIQKITPQRRRRSSVSRGRRSSLEYYQVIRGRVTGEIKTQEREDSTVRWVNIVEVQEFEEHALSPVSTSEEMVSVALPDSKDDPAPEEDDIIWAIYHEGYQTVGVLKLEGSIQSITSFSVVLDGSASDEDDFYNNMTLRMTSGAAKDEQVTIAVYHGSTHTADTTEWPNVQPSPGDSYEVLESTDINWLKMPFGKTFQILRGEMVGEVQKKKLGDDDVKFIEIDHHTAFEEFSKVPPLVIEEGEEEEPAPEDNKTKVAIPTTTIDPSLVEDDIIWAAYHKGIASYEKILSSGVLGTVTSATAVIIDSEASEEDDAYNYCYIRFLSGPADGTETLITDYIGADKKVVVEEWETSPTYSDNYEIYEIVEIDWYKLPGGRTTIKARVYETITAATTNLNADWGSGLVNIQHPETGILMTYPTSVDNDNIGTSWEEDCQVTLDLTYSPPRVIGGSCQPVNWEENES